MTDYYQSTREPSPISAAAKVAKAKRKAVLERVRAQRVHAYKKTVNELKKRYAGT